MSSIVDPEGARRIMYAIYGGNFYKYRDGKEHVAYETIRPLDTTKEYTICGKTLAFSSTPGTGYRYRCKDCENALLLWELGE